VSAWTESLTGRTGGYLARRAAPAWRASLTGRFLALVWRGLRAVCSGSLFFSLRGALSRPLTAAAAPGSPVVERAFATGFIWLGGALGERWPGRATRALSGMAASSDLRDGGWARIVGALVGGLAFARVARGGSAGVDQAALVALGCAGLLAAVFGPTLVRGWNASAVSRVVGDGDPSSSAPPSYAWPSPVQPGRGGVAVTDVAVVLAAAAGIAAGAAPGSSGLVAVALGAVVCLGVFSLYRPELLLLVVAAFPWVNWGARKVLAGTPLAGASDDLLILASFACLLFCILIVRRWDLRTVPVVLPLAVAFTAGLGSILLNDVPSQIGIFALRVTFEPLLFFFLGYLLPKDRRWVRMAVAAFLAASVFLALHGLYQYATHAPMPASWVDAHETTLGTRAYSIVENPNGLGAFLAMGSLISLALVLGKISTRWRVVMAFVTLVLVAGLGATFSRGAWLGFALGAAALLALSRPRLLGGLAAVALLSPLVLPAAITNRVAFAFSSEYLAKSANAGRLLMWDVALFRIADHPWFGVGLGTFGGTSAYLFDLSRHWVDNFYLQLAAEGGLILLFAFLWILLRAAKGVVASHGKARDPYFRAVSAGIFGAFIAVCVANVTSSVWETLIVGAAFWFLLGLGGSLPVGEEEGRRLTKIRELGPELPEGVVSWARFKEGTSSARPRAATGSPGGAGG
jgi:O-antigen ligase